MRKITCGNCGKEGHNSLKCEWYNVEDAESVWWNWLKTTGVDNSTGDYTKTILEFITIKNFSKEFDEFLKNRYKEWFDIDD